MERIRSIIKDIRQWVPTWRDGAWLLAGAAVALAIVGISSRMEPAASTPLAVPDPDQPEVSIAWLPETVQHWEDDLAAAGKQYNIDPELLAIIMTIESGGYTQAVSPADAQGLMQVIPPTGEDIAKRHLHEPREEYDLLDPATSIEFGTAYLAMLRDAFGEQGQGPSWDSTAELVAAGYNGGPGAASSLYEGEGLSSSETASYARDVYGMWRERHAAESPTYDRWFERGGYRLIERAEDEQNS